MSAQSESLPIPASQRMAIDVERGLREQQVGIFFVMPRVVRRVLQNELDIASPWQPPPHRKCCVIPRDRLLWLVARDELGVDASTRLPEQIILIAQPEEDQLATMTRQELQRHYWRLMFHARIDYAMAARTSVDQMPAADLRQRIDSLGQTAFDEIRSVLRAEQMLLRPDDDRNIYSEFVAVYHELTAFAPKLVSLYFPSLTSPQNVLDVIGPDCDAAELLSSTRPADLDPTEPLSPMESDSAMSVHQPSTPAVPRKKSARQSAGLVRRAERLSFKENNVRAALTLQTALDVSPEDQIDRVKDRLQQEIQKLVSRLQAALKLSDHEANPWLKMCEVLLTGAQQGFWNANARLLYDLQKVCYDHEHEVYKVDLLRWAVSMGKTPLKRPLPNQRVVQMSKHLRGATLRVPHVEIDPHGRKELSHLLHEAASAAERLLRGRIEPLIEHALLDAGFRPATAVERVASKKMVHELADSVVTRGFITLGSLRDAVSRNQLKMPDLTDANEFLTGDPLLRADRLMAAALDGVYPRGPLYLRWLQKVSSVAYGTPLGRLFIRYIALPFGLSFLLLKTLDVAAEHLPFLHPKATVAAEIKSVEAASSTSSDVASTSVEQAVEHAAEHVAEASSPNHPVHHHVDVLYSHQSMFLLGCVIFALLHFPTFRQRVIWVVMRIWTALRILLFDAPRAILRWKLVDRFLKSFPMMLFRRFVVAPLMATALICLILPGLGFYPELNHWWNTAVFLASFLVLNSRVGRDTEELAREFFGRTWYRIRVHLLMGIFTLVLDLFRAMMDGLERVLYAVDEWLRFRSGESDLTLGIKAVVGLVWSVVNAVIRFCVTLLIEPQVNPIKHFPVVTVSHKIVLTTLTLPIYSILIKFFDEPAKARAATVLLLTSIPGVFGFLAWELKENWKLYKANRSPKLKPVPIGDHGETLLRLLCPGFHSGTIPRLFALRRRAARRDPNDVTEHKQARFIERLHHEAAAVRHFIERELLALLSESRTFRDYPFRVGDVDLTTNRVLVKIEITTKPYRPVQLEFAEQSGWLVAVVREAGWLDEIEPDDAEVFQAAVTGLYKLAAVDLVREQIQRQLIMDSHQVVPPGQSQPEEEFHPYDISSTGLIIWPHSMYETEVYYPLDEEPVTHPRPRFLARATGLHPLPLDVLVFERHELDWEEWQRFWDNEQNLPAHSLARFPFKW